MADWQEIVSEFESMAERFEELADSRGDTTLREAALRLRHYAEQIREDERNQPRLSFG
jgi:hypothetical protein